MSSGILSTTWSGAIEQTKGDVVWADLSFLVAFFIPGISASASTESNTINMDMSLPRPLTPSETRTHSGLVLNGGSQELGTYTIGTDGSVTVSVPGGFSDNGENGTVFQGVSYVK